MQIVAVPWFFNASVLAAALTGAVTAAGWFVLKSLDVRAQARARKAEFRRSYTQKQIEEFYGPLYSLVWQVIAMNHLKESILANRALPDRDRISIQEYFATKYFLPTHERIRVILETKLYLLDGTMMPDSFYDYLRHALQESAQHELWFERNVDTSYIAGLPYPDGFQRTIYSSLLKLTREYEISVEELRGKRHEDRVAQSPRKKGVDRDEDPRFDHAI